MGVLNAQESLDEEFLGGNYGLSRSAQPKRHRINVLRTQGLRLSLPCMQIFG